MREINWLGALQMGVPGHQHLGMFLRQQQKRVLQRAETCNNLVNLITGIKTKVERDLVVATAPRVQFGAGWSDPFSQRRLDVHMDVFQGCVPDECSSRDFVFDLAQPARDHLKFASGENSNASESRGMCDRTGNVVMIKPPVEGN